MTHVGRLPSGFLLLCIVACGTTDLDADVRDLRARTIPIGASLSATSAIERDSWGAAATWQVEAPMTWDDYVRRVRARLSEFVERPDTEAAQFTRAVGGDTQTLRLDLLEGGPPLRVRVTFNGHAG